MKLIIGLGNPGNEYKNTRHNIGFEVIDQLSKRLDISFANFKNIAYIAKAVCDTTNVILVKPLTYMNKSGIAVLKLKQYYKINIKDILIIVDDYNLDLGNIRFKTKGSSGGHNGLQSIINSLGDQEFARLRIGIGKPCHKNLSDFVLSKFKPNERIIISDMINNACDAVDIWLNQGSDIVMQKCNKKNIKR